MFPVPENGPSGRSCRSNRLVSYKLRRSGWATTGEGNEKGAEAMSEENKALVRREIEELFNHTGNLDVAQEVYAADFVGHDPTMPQDLHGIEAARQFAASFRNAFPDLSCTIEEQIAEGDKVVSRWRASGTHEGETEGLGPPTGNRIEITASLSRGSLRARWWRAGTTTMRWV